MRTLHSSLGRRISSSMYRGTFCRTIITSSSTFNSSNNTNSINSSNNNNSNSSGSGEASWVGVQVLIRPLMRWKRPCSRKLLTQGVCVLSYNACFVLWLAFMCGWEKLVLQESSYVIVPFGEMGFVMDMDSNRSIMILKVLYFCSLLCCRVA